MTRSELLNAIRLLCTHANVSYTSSPGHGIGAADERTRDGPDRRTKALFLSEIRLLTKASGNLITRQEGSQSPNEKFQLYCPFRSFGRSGQTWYSLSPMLYPTLSLFLFLPLFVFSPPVCRLQKEEMLGWKRDADGAVWRARLLRQDTGNVGQTVSLSTVCFPHFFLRLSLLSEAREG